jgi:hypothetical protein
MRGEAGANVGELPVSEEGAVERVVDRAPSLLVIVEQRNAVEDGPGRAGGADAALDGQVTAAQTTVSVGGDAPRGYPAPPRAGPQGDQCEAGSPVDGSRNSRSAPCEFQSNMLFSCPAAASAAPPPMRALPSQLSSMNFTTEDWSVNVPST